MNIDIIKKKQNGEPTIIYIMKKGTDTEVAHATEKPEGGIEAFRFIPNQSAYTTLERLVIARALDNFYEKERR